ncbi:hypothetical protein RhiirA5_394687 [Rhizophagus irregularis]|uniref:NYN domain-containing protein n=3 Tax=Rhizophagus irregularis TaxID=588596 RepID=U9V3D5_RHIID|nr:hypothetical protein GLOIN_2v1473159 [Rhizophagus irregularis DAOM 181602=DAOM 197198]EXX68435.1 hypothetical protein RirG_105240 [Rhizophagus irregularis DAOM 197198w]PKC15947.1 hypothetical protein RhiirA5_394687 [Rhizophagus irregularis]PKC74469.1 hypothetical protein RhiirA1_529567 [Rhizophagus irregularis]PKY14047.1 hypothetical protein RhiirB3_519288 [Rhizophagus irregularis]POG78310.1 hypothetical protein GLOIN_2v1473159 [Rhizophagus irregularis DAOM 181602=DAOM 197198]|eukprot:XP_025185176.1 hypothetical protein GLOIN_2v1473159 [Rhizophagus irregularis DAOM 181602=DAOM 197198]
MAAPAASDLVYIFIDYSNVTYGSQSNLRIANDVFNVDPNRLVITVCNGRKLGGVFIAGSDPPIDDELWVRALDLKFNVNIFPLTAGREKKVDTQLAVDMMDIIYSKNPGTLVLVSGDADFIIPLDKAKEKNWRIEIWSWSRGISNELKKFPYLSLEDHFKSFAYITEKHATDKRHTLEISGDIINSWKCKNEPIMECFRALNLLCQFYWEDDTTAHLYFDSESKLIHARDWLSKSYPDLLVNEPFLIVTMTESIMLVRD